MRCFGVRVVGRDRVARSSPDTRLGRSRSQLGRVGREAQADDIAPYMLNPRYRILSGIFDKEGDLSDLGVEPTSFQQFLGSASWASNPVAVSGYLTAIYPTYLPDTATLTICRVVYVPTLTFTDTDPDSLSHGPGARPTDGNPIRSLSAAALGRPTPLFLLFTT